MTTPTTTAAGATGGRWPAWERGALAALLLGVGALYLATLPTISSCDGYSYILELDGIQPFTEFLRVMDTVPVTHNYEHLGKLHPHHVVTNAVGTLSAWTWAALGWTDGARVPWLFANVLWGVALLGLLYGLLRRIVSRGVAFATVATMAATSGQWGFSTAAEVYPSGAAAVALLLLVLHRVWSRPTIGPRAVVGLGATHGFAALVHIQNGALVLPIALFLVLRGAPRRRIATLVTYGAVLGAVVLAVLVPAAVWGAGASNPTEVLEYLLLYPLYGQFPPIGGMPPSEYPYAVWLVVLSFGDILAFPGGLPGIVFTTVLVAIAGIALGPAFLRPLRTGGPIRRRLAGVFRATDGRHGFVAIAAAMLVTDVLYLGHVSPFSNDYPLMVLPAFGVLFASGLALLADRVPVGRATARGRALRAAAAAAVAGLLALHTWTTVVGPRAMSAEEARAHFLTSFLPPTDDADLIVMNERINQREKWWLFRKVRPAAAVAYLRPDGLDEMREQARATLARGGVVYFTLAVDGMEDPADPEVVGVENRRYPVYRRFIAALAAELDAEARETYRWTYHPGAEILRWYSYRVAVPVEKAIIALSRPGHADEAPADEAPADGRRRGGQPRDHRTAPR